MCREVSFACVLSFCRPARLVFALHYCDSPHQLPTGICIPAPWSISIRENGGQTTTPTASSKSRGGHTTLRPIHPAISRPRNHSTPEESGVCATSRQNKRPVAPLPSLQARGFTALARAVGQRGTPGEPACRAQMLCNRTAFLVWIGAGCRTDVVRRCNALAFSLLRD